MTNSKPTSEVPRCWSIQTLPAWTQAVSLLFGAVMAGVMIGAAWRNEPWGWVGVGGIACFLFMQVRLRLWPALMHAFVAGTASFLVACPWLPSTVMYLAECDPGIAHLIAGLFYSLQSLGLVLFAGIWSCLRRKGCEAWIMTPVIWVGLEQWVPTLFPWPPAVMLTADLPMLQLAEVGGVHLVSLLVVSLASFLAWTMRELWDGRQCGSLGQRSVGLWCLVLVAFVLLRFWGSHRVNQFEQAIQRNASGLKVGLVQADTGYFDSNQRMIETTREMEGMLDLVIWPEAALGNYSRRLVEFSDPVVVAQKSKGDGLQFVPFPDPHCLLLAGADTWEEEADDGGRTQQFVSALLIDQQQRLIGRRDKSRLMPYGEYIPGEAIVPAQRDWFGSERSITPGTSNDPIGSIKGFRMGVLLCCEDMHPDLVRDVAGRGVDCLVTLGNGMAFDSEIALRQHFRIAQLRAIEHRLSFIRCTSTGISGWITPSGRVGLELPALQDTATILTIPKVTLAAPTFFGQCGWLVCWLVGTASIVVFVYQSALSRHNSLGPATPEKSAG